MPQIDDNTLIKMVINNAELPRIEYDQLLSVVEGVKAHHHTTKHVRIDGEIMFFNNITGNWVLSAIKHLNSFEVRIAGNDSENPHVYSLRFATFSLDDEASAESMAGCR